MLLDERYRRKHHNHQRPQNRAPQRPQRQPGIAAQISKDAWDGVPVLVKLQQEHLRRIRCDICSHRFAVTGLVIQELAVGLPVFTRDETYFVA